MKITSNYHKRKPARKYNKDTRQVEDGFYYCGELYFLSDFNYVAEIDTNFAPYWTHKRLFEYYGYSEDGLCIQHGWDDDKEYVIVGFYTYRDEIDKWIKETKGEVK